MFKDDDDGEYDGIENEKEETRKHLAERNKKFVNDQRTKELVKEMEIPDVPFEDSPFQK